MKLINPQENGGGTIEGALQAGQIAYGAAQDTITGDSRFQVIELDSLLTCELDAGSTATQGAHSAFYVKLESTAGGAAGAQTAVYGQATLNPGTVFSSGGATGVFGEAVLPVGADNSKTASTYFYGVQGQATLTPSATSGTFAASATGVAGGITILGTNPSGTTTITQVAGLSSSGSALNLSGGTVAITTYYGLYLGNFLAGGGSTIGTKYGVYQVDTASTNYLAGGLNVPGGSKLELYHATTGYNYIRWTGASAMFAGSNFDGSLVAGYQGVTLGSTISSDQVLARFDTTNGISLARATSIDLGTGTLPGFPNVAQSGLTLAGAASGATTPAVRGVGYASTGLSLIGQAAEGNRTTPSAIGDGRAMVNLLGYGYDGLAWVASPSARYDIRADGLWSDTNHGGYHYWAGTPNGSLAAAEWMRLQNSILLVLSGPAWSSTGLVGEIAGQHLALSYDTTASVADIRSVNNGTAFTELRLTGNPVSIYTGAGNVTPHVAFYNDKTTTFSGTVNQSLSGQGYVYNYIYLGTNSADQKWTWWNYHNGGLIAYFGNDANNASSEWLNVSRSGYVVQTVTFPTGNVGVGASAGTTSKLLVQTGGYAATDAAPQFGVAKFMIAGSGLGASVGDRVNLVNLVSTTSNTDYLRIYHRRVLAGSNWDTASLRIQRTVDITPMSFMEFVNSGGYNAVVLGGDNYASFYHLTIDSSGRGVTSIGAGPSTSATLTLGRTDSTYEGGELVLCRSTDNTMYWHIDSYGGAAPNLRIFSQDGAALSDPFSFTNGGVFYAAGGMWSSSAIYQQNNLTVSGSTKTCRVGFLNPRGSGGGTWYSGMYLDNTVPELVIESLEGGVAWRDVHLCKASGGVLLGPVNRTNVYHLNAVYRNICAWSSGVTDAAEVAAVGNQYFSAPYWNLVALRYYDTSYAGSQYGIPQAGLGQLIFQNCANAMIGTNAGTGVIAFHNGYGISFRIDADRNLYFPGRTAQFLNLYDTGYGIGVQSWTQYFRTADRFAWYKGGVHSDTAWDPGSGGSILALLDGNGVFTATGGIITDVDMTIRRTGGSPNMHLIYQFNSVNRAYLFYSTGGEALQLDMYSSSSVYARSFSLGQSGTMVWSNTFYFDAPSSYFTQHAISNNYAVYQVTRPDGNAACHTYMYTDDTNPEYHVDTFNRAGTRWSGLMIRQNQGFALGGSSATASGDRSGVLGGNSNSATTAYSIVVGGSSNSAAGSSSTVLGGTSNTTNASFTAIVGGGYHSISSGASYSVIIAGSTNLVGGGVGSAVVVGGNTNTANYSNSGILAGEANLTAGNHSVVLGGVYNYTYADSSVAIGQYAKADHICELAHGGGQFATRGDAQGMTMVQYLQTTNATLTAMTSPTNMTMPDYTVWAVEALVSLKQVGNTTARGYVLRATFYRGAGAGTVTMATGATNTSIGAAGVTCALAPDTSFGGPKINCTGIAAHTINWVAYIRIAQASTAS